MIHKYKSRKYNDTEFLQFCTGQWVSDDARTVTRATKWGSTYGPAHFTSVDHNVTCPKCLDVLIPKKQAELDRMLRARERAKEKETPS